MKRIGFLAVAAASLLAGCQVATRPSADAGTAPQPIAQAEPTSTKVSRRDIVGYRLMGGVLQLPPNAQAEVYSSMSMPIEQVRVKEGDHVSRGQTLIELASGDDANYEQAKQTYTAALAAYNQALAQYEQPVRDAQRTLDQAKATERTLRQATVPGGDASQLQSATAARQSAEDAVKVARAQAQTNELPYKQQLDQAKSALDQAKAGVRQSNVTAPLTGTVVALTATVGEVPNSKTALARIVDLAALTIRSEAGADDAAYVKKGTPVVVLFNNYPDKKFTGRIRSVNTLPADNARPRLAAVVDFDNSGGVIKPDSSVRTVGIVVGHHNNVLTVPVDAVGKDTTGKPVVKVLENGNWKPLVVETGMTDGYFVEVTSGLEDDQTVQVVPGQGQWLLGS